MVQPHHRRPVDETHEAVPHDGQNGCKKKRPPLFCHTHPHDAVTLRHYRTSRPLLYVAGEATKGIGELHGQSRSRLGNLERACIAVLDKVTSWT